MTWLFSVIAVVRVREARYPGYVKLVCRTRLCVLGWSWVSEIEKDLVIVLYEVLSHIKRPNNKWHLRRTNYIVEFSTEIPSTLCSSIPLAWLWLIVVVSQVKQQLSLTLRGCESSCGNYILFLLCIWRVSSSGWRFSQGLLQNDTLQIRGQWLTPTSLSSGHHGNQFNSLLFRQLCLAIFLIGK